MASRTTETRSRRGAIVTETALLLVVMTVCLLVGPTVWRVWSGVLKADAEAHRKTFFQACTLYDQSVAPAPGPGAEVVATPRVHPPYPFYYVLGRTKLDPREWAGTLATTHLTFPNGATEGVGAERVRFAVGVPGLRYEAGIEVERRGYVIRTPWTWSGYPIVHTQDHFETDDIHGWLASGYEWTMTRWPVARIQPKDGMFLDEDIE